MLCKLLVYYSNIVSTDTIYFLDVFDLQLVESHHVGLRDTEG